MPHASRLTPHAWSVILVTVGVSALVALHRLPLGVAGEWQWPIIGQPPDWASLVITTAITAAYCGLAAWAYRGLHRRPRWAPVLVLVLVPAGIGLDLAIQDTPPLPWNLGKWAFALEDPHISGYFTAARHEVRDARRFLGRYDRFAAHADVFHVGTHPPGLFLFYHGLRVACRRHPELARWAGEHQPESVRLALDEIGRYQPLDRADRATLWLAGLITQVLSGLTVVPIYALARRSLAPAAAWLAAALWPLVPSVCLFMPDADAAYPLLAVTLVWLGLSGWDRGTGWKMLGAGLLLWLGMFCSLAFVAVALLMGAAVGLEVLGGRRPALDASSGSAAPSPTRRPLVTVHCSLRRGLTWTGAAAVGWLIPSLALGLWAGYRPIRTWVINYQKHAVFYTTPGFQRSYGTWLWADLIELAIAGGMAITAWAAVELIGSVCRGLARRGPAPRVAWAWLIVLIALDLSGKNLGEVARLWLFLMPFPLVAAAAAVQRLSDAWLTALLTLVVQAGQTVALVVVLKPLFPV